MTSSPRTRQWTIKAQDSRRRATSVGLGAEGSVPARARQTLPAVDPSIVFGCVDWFLYPDQSVGRSASEAQRIPA
jgi:hypothetical protein